MLVAVDATAIPADRGGVGRYVEALLPALAEHGLDMAVIAKDQDAERLAGLAPAAELVVAPRAVARRPTRLMWEQVGLPRVLRALRVDVLHSPHYTMPVSPGVPVVVTLHDATFFSHPELHTALKARFFRAATRTAVRRAAALVVPSLATRDAVVRFTGGDVSRFTVAYHGVDPAVFHAVGPDEMARVRTSLGLGGRSYVAFLGTLEPRKNVPALIRGWARAVGGSAEPPALVLAGGRGWDTGVDAAVASVPDGLDVMRPGYLPIDDLAPFLSAATVVAYPSLGEGFGLPVLEAMACGAPVLTTRELSLPEVGGDAVAYCGTDAESIAASLRELLADPRRRADLARAGQERATGFTWNAAATAHLRAYESAIGA